MFATAYFLHFLGNHSKTAQNIVFFCDKANHRENGGIFKMAEVFRSSKKCKKKENNELTESFGSAPLSQPAQYRGGHRSFPPRKP